MPPTKSSKESEERDVVVETDPDGRYQRYKTLLGSGSFKSVYKAFDSEVGIEVAWNQVKIGRLQGAEKDQFIEEVTLLRKLRHKNIIECYHYWEDEENQQVNFITELMTSGTLKSFVKSRKVNFRTIRKWARQILSALQYLHTDFETPIIHRDLKCDNIFINGNLGEVKLGDLGLSTMMTQTHAQSVIGTPEFMAPELYEEQYNEKVDIYAFGMCILEIFTNEYPYNECTNAAQIYKKVTQGHPPATLEKIENIAVKHFIEACLASEEDRPSAESLLTHELLIDFDKPPDTAQPAGSEGAVVDTPTNSRTSSEAWDPTGQQKKSDAPSEHQNPVPPTQPATPASQNQNQVQKPTEASRPDILSAEMKVIDPTKDEDADEVGPDTGKMCVKAVINGKTKLIEFNFDIETDSPEEVANQLIEEIAASPETLPKCIELIERAVEAFKAESRHQVAETLPSGETVKVNTELNGMPTSSAQGTDKVSQPQAVPIDSTKAAAASQSADKTPQAQPVAPTNAKPVEGFPPIEGPSSDRPAEADTEASKAPYKAALERSLETDVTSPGAGNPTPMSSSQSFPEAMRTGEELPESETAQGLHSEDQAPQRPPASNPIPTQSEAAKPHPSATPNQTEENASASRDNNAESQKGPPPVSAEEIRKQQLEELRTKQKAVELELQQKTKELQEWYWSKIRALQAEAPPGIKLQPQQILRLERANASQSQQASKPAAGGESAKPAAAAAATEPAAAAAAVAAAAAAASTTAPAAPAAPATQSGSGKVAGPSEGPLGPR